MTGYAEHAALRTRRSVCGSDRGADRDGDDQNRGDGPEHRDTSCPRPATSAGLGLLSPAKVEDRRRAHHVGWVGGPCGDRSAWTDIARRCPRRTDRPACRLVGAGFAAEDGGARGVRSDNGPESSSSGIGRVGVDDEVVIELVVSVQHSQAATAQTSERPHPDRGVHDPGQPDLAGCIAGDEPDDDREEAESGERPDDEFHE
jgi:hypothetical protein